MTVSRLERELPYRELVEWTEEYRRDPWGTWRDNTHAAMICSLIANAFRGKDGRSFSTEDFMLLDAETAAQKRAEKVSKGNKALVAALSSIAKH